MQPGIYAGIYGATVAEFPKAMFLMSAFLLYLAVAMLLGVRPNVNVLPADDVEYRPAPEDEEAVSEEEDGDEDEGEEGDRRGRIGPHLEADAARRRSVTRLSVSEETL